MTPVAKGGNDDLENLKTLCENCHKTKRENSGWFDQQYPTEEFLDAIADADSSGTQDVADYVGCSYETAYKKLRRLEGEGTIESQKVANARAWLLADDE